MNALPSKRITCILVTACFVVVALLSAMPLKAAELTSSEKNGKQLYLTGTGASGAAIKASLGEGVRRLELPGEAAVCGSCHGKDGAGRPESGVLPSNITWKYLTRSYGHVHARGLEHAAFTKESLKRYIKTGTYPNGRKGDSAMPVYEIPDDDLDDLVAYLKRVGEIRDPGLSDTAIKLGTILPSGGSLGGIGTVIRDVLEAYFRDVNQTGGIYGRRLELVVREIPTAREPALEMVDNWLDEEQPFALVSPFTPRIDFEVQSLLSGNEVPVIAPFTLYAIRTFVLNRYVFYLYPGLGEQVDALVQFAAVQLELSNPRIAVLYPDENSLTKVIDALEKTVRKQGWKEIRREAFPVDGFDAVTTVKALHQAGIDVVISLGVEPELQAFLREADERKWWPHVLATGALSGGALFEAPPGFEKRLYMAYPTLPQDRKPWALRDVSRLLAGNETARSHVQAVVSAYASARVLVEALRRAGKDPGRLRLTGELEKLYEFETGLTPPVTFTSNRRIGARGAYVIGAGSLVEGRLPESVAWVDVK